MTTAIKPVEVQTIAQTTINELMKQWLEFVDVQPTTFTTYQRVLKNFGKYLAENNISELNRAVVISYRDSILDRLQPTTCRLYISCVKLFVKFLASKGYCPDFTDNFKGVKLHNDTHYRDALTADESREVFHAMQGENEKALRDKAIVGLMLATGLRCIEVTRLDVGDIEKRGKKLFLKVHGKGRQGKQDSVILPAQCAALIQAYLKTRQNVTSTEPLFVSTSHRCKGNRLQAQTVSRLCKKALVNAGFDSSRLTAHSFRHAFCTIALVAGVAMREVSMAARHLGGTKITENYAHDLSAINNRTTTVVANLIF